MQLRTAFLTADDSGDGELSLKEVSTQTISSSNFSFSSVHQSVLSRSWQRSELQAAQLALYEDRR